VDAIEGLLFDCSAPSRFQPTGSHPELNNGARNCLCDVQNHTICFCKIQAGSKDISDFSTYIVARLPNPSTTKTEHNVSSFYHMNVGTYLESKMLGPFGFLKISIDLDHEDELCQDAVINGESFTVYIVWCQVCHRSARIENHFVANKRRRLSSNFSCHANIRGY